MCMAVAPQLGWASVCACQPVIEADGACSDAGEPHTKTDGQECAQQEARTERLHLFELHRPDGRGRAHGLCEGGHACPSTQHETDPTTELATCDHRCHGSGERDAQLDEEGAEPHEISE